MPRPTHPTKTAPVKDQARFESFPNAGPNPNITGMKEKFWGLDAYCIRCGAYVYKVPKKLWDQY